LTGGERGFLLLTSSLGDPERKPLTISQFRILAKRATGMEGSAISREIIPEDLVNLGYDRSMARRIVQLLAEGERLDRYLLKGKRWDCVPLTRVSGGYPVQVRHRLGLDAPGCLWTKGDTGLLNTQMVSLVGSRDLSEPNRCFAETVGRETARQGFTLVSGNARGADRVAQDACLEAGGRVISVVADALEKYPVRKNMLYLSEEGYDLSFSAARALSRNRVIHTLGYITLVAQCGLETGGTWDGTVKNLQNNWSPVFCFDDGSQASAGLAQYGAKLINVAQLSDLPALQPDTYSFCK